MELPAIISRTRWVVAGASLFLFMGNGQASLRKPVASAELTRIAATAAGQGRNRGPSLPEANTRLCKEMTTPLGPMLPMFLISTNRGRCGACRMAAWKLKAKGHMNRQSTSVTTIDFPFDCRQISGR